MSTKTGKPCTIRTPLSIYDDETLIKDILKPLSYDTSDRKNSIKQHLLKLLATWIEVPDDKMQLIDELIYNIYNSTLMLDDIEDSAILRRSKPSAYTVFGIIRTLIAFNLTQITEMDIVEKLDNPKLLEKLGRVLPELLAGQGMELYWRDNNICPTEKEFIGMMYFKSAVSFMLIAEVLSLFGKRNWTRYERLMKFFGYYFQINDDYQNLRNPVYHEQKGFCEDLSEGKFSFTIVHAINNFPKEGSIIRGILKERTHDIEKKKYCLSLLEKCGSFAYTENALKDLKEVMFEEIRKIDDDPMLRQFLETAILSYL